MEKSVVEAVRAATAQARREAVDFLREIVEIESPAREPEKVERVGRALAAAMPSGFAHRRVSAPGFADHHVFERPVPGRLPVVMVGHMDTICPPGFRGLVADKGRLRGPGVADMKGGLAVIVFSLRVLERCGLLEGLPVTCVFNSDEEVNSPTSRDLFLSLEGRGRAGLVFESAGAGNTVVTTRISIRVYEIAFRGRQAHAGLFHGRKSSALLEMAHRLVALEKLNRPGGRLSVNVGLAGGGTAYNAVPGEAKMTVEMRGWEESSLDRLAARVEASLAEPVVPGCRAKMRPVTSRPAMSPDRRARKLFRLAVDTASLLGRPLPEEKRRGGSDAGWLNRAGIPCLDGLGPIGDNDFTPQEYIEEDSLFHRIELVACLLYRLSGKEFVP